MNFLINIFDFIKNNLFDKVIILISIFIDPLFKIIEKILIKLRVTTKEKLTGITSADELYIKALKHEKRNDPMSAIEIYKEALRLDPKKIEALLNIGNIYDDLMQKEHAIEYYKRAIEIKPDYIKAIYNLATCYIEINENDKAYDLINKLNNLSPEQYSYLQNEIIKAKKSV